MEEKVKNDILRQVIDEAAESCRDYLETALPEIRKLGSEFYRIPGAETWSKFGQMTEGLDWIMRMLYSVTANRHLYSNGDRYAEIAERLNNLLAELNNAVQGGDTVFTGDLILYELYPVLESLQEAVEETVSANQARVALH